MALAWPWHGHLGQSLDAAIEDFLVTGGNIPSLMPWPHLTHGQPVQAVQVGLGLEQLRVGSGGTQADR